MNLAISSSSLTRRFGKLAAVLDLDLQVKEGSITAFLGPNGAGKTTTIRLLLGLLKPDRGSCEVLGYPPGHIQALAQLGALVETPSLYDHLTGIENVEITRLLRAAPRTETSRVLSLVGLSSDSRKIVRTYSLGMRQRLGLALALIGKPRLLILDEPTNGLDPAGIQDIRELIRLIPRDMGSTIFLSSHLLSEVEQVADQVVVIHQGQLRYQGSLDQLGGECPNRLTVRVDRPEEALRQLTLQGFSSELSGGQILVSVSVEDSPRVAELLVSHKIAIYELYPRSESLEARFLKLVGSQ